MISFLLKAIPTAEGAIQIAMENMPTTIAWSKSLVIGNGRIGKVLSKKLLFLGSKVTVSARKRSDFADVFSNNIESVDFCEIQEFDYDVIFNTVPKCVLTKEILMKIPDDTLIIDLASSPGGVDFECAEVRSKKVIWALSLPGKVAPKTASKFLFSAIIDILSEVEVIK
ncbi:MAG: hypothetical protein R3Y09_02425 [Clostridia bacterium]